MRSSDFVYAKNVGLGVALGSMVKKAPGKVFNIGSDKIYTSADFFKVLHRLFPKREIQVVKGVGSGSEGNERIRLDLS